jgi:C-terminal processing protease CtpA/Prc
LRIGMERNVRKRRSGLNVTLVGDRLKVLLVAPGSLAAETGWKEGDEITAIDGQKIGPAYPGSPCRAGRKGRPERRSR